MPKPIDLDAILEKQPQIDPKELQASRELQERLSGAGRRGYELVPPYSGRQVQPVDVFAENPDTLPNRNRS
jgi:hypothetical protein